MSIDSVWVVPDDVTLAEAARAIAEAQANADESLNFDSAIETLGLSSREELRDLADTLKHRTARTSPAIMMNAFNQLVDHPETLSSGLILLSIIQPAIHSVDWRAPANRASSRHLFNLEAEETLSDAEFEVLIAVVHASEATGIPAMLLTGNEKLARLADKCGVGQGLPSKSRNPGRHVRAATPAPVVTVSDSLAPVR